MRENENSPRGAGSQTGTKAACKMKETIKAREQEQIRSTGEKKGNRNRRQVTGNLGQKNEQKINSDSRNKKLK